MLCVYGVYCDILWYIVVGVVCVVMILTASMCFIVVLDAATF
jgi:hypothetical protein